MGELRSEEHSFVPKECIPRRVTAVNGLGRIAPIHSEADHFKKLPLHFTTTLLVNLEVNGMAKVKAKKEAAANAANAAGDGISWIPAEKEYSLALLDGKVVGRNPKGAKLASVPPWLKDTELAQQLTSLRDWLDEHEKQCVASIELWMLRSLPVPRDVLAAVWPDTAWQSVLTNSVVCAVKNGEISQSEAGFLRHVDEKKGVGVVDLDGETQWLKVDAIAIPHPILLAELNDFRQLTIELGIQQSLDQLFRQTWAPTKEQSATSSINDFSNGKFAQLNHVLGLCRRLGYRVSGGYACCPVWENGTQFEARYWIGSDYPEGETWTADLIFTDAKEHLISIKDVGPVAFSEGMRMASAIYAKRVVEKTEESN